MRSKRARGRRGVHWRALAILAWALSASVVAGALEIPSPSGAPGFGWQVKVLPNGNIVINDPNAGPSESGAVHLYRPDGTRISTLTGSSPYDYVGEDPVIVLPDGNFLVVSYSWNNGTALRAGAVTWVSATDGLDGEISAENSIVGTSEDDAVGGNVFVLANGNYLVASVSWHNNGVEYAGAVTWGSRDGTTHGPVSPANSLVGTTTFDYVGASVTVLANGNYLVVSPLWNNGAATQAGAITWADGETGVAGAVSAENSLVGATAGDMLGNGVGYREHPWILANGNAVVLSPDWDNGDLVDAGAATWIDGTHGLIGTVSASNSLVGTHAGDRIGDGYSYDGFFDLGNGRYAIVSPQWQRDGVARAGAITWGSDASGIAGPVSASNSLVGTAADDLLLAWIRPLANGNAVVQFPNWDNGAVADAGAVTWIDGTAPVVGTVSAANSLVGSMTNDYVGKSVTPLANGNYVVVSPEWHNGSAAVAGAATWMDGTHAGTGAVSTSNSLYGADNDWVADAGVVALANGNYVVLSDYWNNGAATGAGAVTWGDGAHGIVGAVSPANSLVGDSPNDAVGQQAFALPGGNVAIMSASWHQVGAVTWMDGASGRVGPVSSVNSLVGNQIGDDVGTVTVLGGSGNYVVGVPHWGSGTHYDLGAAAWGNARTGVAGPISSANALVGTDDGDQIGQTITAVGNGNAVIDNHTSVTLMRGASGLAGGVSAADTIHAPDIYGAGSIDYDATHDRLVVGWYRGYSVTVFQADLVFKNGLD